MGRGEDLAQCEFSPEEVANLEQLLRAMLTYDPSKRISASAAVHSEWMENWSRPAMKLVLQSDSTASQDGQSIDTT
jgi:hypothetical protein